MNLKITDIAKLANVSPATVSRVIHNSGYVAKDKREIVTKVLNELGYVPNRVAQGLKRQETKMIGHILPAAYPNPFFAGISQGVDHEAYGRGYHVLTLFSYHDPQREKNIISEMVSRRVDGIVFTDPASGSNVKSLVGAEIPVVMVERAKDVIGVDKVLVDNIEGSMLAAQYLLERNHRRIAFIGQKPQESVEAERFEGFSRVMKSGKLPLEKELVKLCSSYKPENGYELMAEIATGGKLPTAVFVSSDILAIGVLQYLYKHKIRVPDDISIIGYDNSYAQVLSPKLTTVALPMQDMGRTAVQMVVDRIENKAATVKTITMHTTIVEGESVKSI